MGIKTPISLHATLCYADVLCAVHDRSSHYGVSHLGALSLSNGRNQAPSEVKISTDDLIETNQNVDLQKFENIKANIEIRKLWI